MENDYITGIAQLVEHDLAKPYLISVTLPFYCVSSILVCQNRSQLICFRLLSVIRRLIEAAYDSRLATFPIFDR
jgi:hypothetical protein